ncbi:recombination protein RecR [Candidatus Saccharibacteria bacterium]|jgi:recombination protein RecR|nr:recombination protein RecR [Candidatus Saccharibacteria bacterium]
MSLLPSALVDLIEALGALPGVGPRTAERYALYLLEHNKEAAKKISKATDDLHDNIAYCPKTFALIESDQSVSPLYDNDERDKQTIAVVEDAFDVVALEKVGSFNGTYHVLGGLLNPLDNVGPDELTITQLLDRIEDDKVKELILATNASVEGESTALYIQKQLMGSNIIITRLARGLPVGVDLDYADIGTLTSAFQNRTTL